MDEMLKENSELELEDILKEFGDFEEPAAEPEEDVQVWGEEPVL